MQKHVNEKTGIAYWRSAGDENKLPVFLVHGHGGDHRGLLPLAKQLNATTYSLDLPGFGESAPLKSHTMAAFAKTLEQLADELELQQYGVIGHSLGAAVALEWSANDPRVKALMLVNPIPAYNKIMKRVLKLVGDMSQKIPEPYGERFVHARLYNLGTFLINSRQRRDREHMLAYLKHQSETKYTLRAWHEAGESAYYYDQHAAAERIKAPTLILHGDRDSLTTDEAIEEFRTLFKQARLVTIPRAGHFMHIENTVLVAAEINEF